MIGLEVPRDNHPCLQKDWKTIPAERFRFRRSRLSFSVCHLSSRDFLPDGSPEIGIYRAASIPLVTSDFPSWSFCRHISSRGLFFSLHGVQDLLALARKRHLSVEQPARPWLGDYAWRSEGFKSSALRETTKPLIAALIGTAVVAPFVWVALANPFAWAFDLFVGMLAALPGLTWWRWLVMLLRTWRFGSSLLVYETFPFFCWQYAKDSASVPAESRFNSIFDSDPALCARKI